jgi:three-Cys-motif partner protein
MPRNFGGTWSDLKLEALRSYLPKYTSALSKQSFELLYIDAFAGAGLREVVDLDEDEVPDYEEALLDLALEQPKQAELSLFDEAPRPEVEPAARHGSPLIALETFPEFHRFIFIEKDPDSLGALRDQVEANYPHHVRLRRVEFREGDANDELQEVLNLSWNSRRAVVFLDPFALQVKWSTIQKIAQTRSIDMWLLFPAMAVNRLMPRNGEVSNEFAAKLTEAFGCSDWEAQFYEKLPPDLLGEERVTKRSTDFFERLSQFLISRLQNEFFGVHDKPLILKSSKGRPLFIFCFASGNPTGSHIALKIADHILKKANGK